MWLADLAGITEPELVPSQVMEALGVRQSGVCRRSRRCVSGWARRGCCWCLTTANICSPPAWIWRGAADRLTGAAGPRDQPGASGLPPEALYPVPPLAVPPEPASEEAMQGRRRYGCSWTADRRPGPVARRRPRRWRWWPGFAASWMGCRWRSSWPPRAPACCRRRRSRRTWRTSSGSWAAGVRRPARGTRR